MDEKEKAFSDALRKSSESFKKVSEAAKKLSFIGAAKGGVARAKKLSPEERSEIARHAVEARWEKAGKGIERLPRATHVGKLDIVEKVPIACAVLDDIAHTRVLSERSIAKSLGKRGGGAHWQRKKNITDGALLPEYVSAKNLETFISSETREKLLNPITYISKSGAKAKGIPASILPEICDIWLKARENSALTESQKGTAKKAEILMRSFAHVGIIALVDEATGYQEVRDKLALQKILEMYIAKELRPWVKTFPDEFYENLFRLRNWQYKPLSVKRPIVVGRITNDLIYKRLAPGVLNAINNATPRDEKGRTKHRFFQHLTEDIGHPKLKEHLISVITLMKASSSWVTFYRLIQRALPQYGKTLELPYGDSEIEKLEE
jgi:hypothetical protein